MRILLLLSVRCHIPFTMVFNTILQETRTRRRQCGDAKSDGFRQPCGCRNGAKKYLMFVVNANHFILFFDQFVARFEVLNCTDTCVYNILI